MNPSTPSIAPNPPPSDGLAVRAQLRPGPGFELDVDVQLPGHGFSAIFGPSGCGKTTLLRCVAGLTRPQTGRIVINGETWQDDAHGIWLPTHQRPLGVVFQEPSLFPHLTVQGNLDFGRQRVPAAERRVSMQQAIELLGIGHLLSRQTAKLSGGERQRVAIARAVATSPRLLLMDEPLAALDAARKAELLPWFERLAHELSIPVLYVTHSVDEVARLADHLLLLDAGRVQAQGATADLMTRLDLPLAHGDDASAVLEGVVQSSDEHYQLLHVRVGRHELQLPLPPGDTAGRLVGQPLRLRVQARDVSLTRSHVADTSILNVLPATIDQLAADGRAQVLVSLRVGRAPLLARITRKSADTMGLAPGQQVFAQVKGVAVLD